MAKKSGKAFQRHYNGSSGSDGRTREGDGYTRSGDTYFKPDGNTGEYVSKRHNRNGRSRDHLHYYVNNETGQHEVKNKSTDQVYLADGIAKAFKDFMCW
jgi:hypothetical protein